MARGKLDTRTDINWILRDRKVIDGLDQLGIELVSVNLYQAMLPGLTNVTERARYFAFYPWTIHRYAHEGPRVRTKAAWRTWFRALDFAYAVACMAYEEERGENRASAVVGADRARTLVKNQLPSARIDLRAPAAVDASGNVPRSGAYFKNPEGGFGQYYKGPLRELGVVRPHESSTWPDVQLSTYAGRRLADTLEREKAFSELEGLAIAGRARLSELSRLGKAVHPSAIAPESEEARLLRLLMFGDDPDLCRGQQPDHLQWRRTSLLLMLQFVRQAGAVPFPVDYKFRWACLGQCLPNGTPWIFPRSLAAGVDAWAAYQRNDVLNYCLECLFYAVLRAIDQGPLRPVDVVGRLAEDAMAAVPAAGTLPRLPSLPRKVADWIAASRVSQHERKGAPWGSVSTWALAGRLESAVNDDEISQVPAIAARLLGRLATERDAARSHLFAAIPQAVEMASHHEVHLQGWWDRIGRHAEEPTREFLAELLLEWVLYRHLRVATRKLANEGVSTFKYRPEEGRLLVVAENLPKPTYTAPRGRQAFRIMEDLHCIRRTDAGAQISNIGEAFLEAHDV
jgi:hypothetical protein